ncbi:MAG: TolC family protein [Bacteroidetes bacterium]|nr:TolC family protein [Bacteroidota bacterium]
MKKKILIILLLSATAFPARSQQIFHYDSLSTFRVLQTGLEANFNIRLKKHLADESQGQLTSVKGAFNPQLSLNTSGLYGTDPTITTRNSYSLEGQLMLPTRLGLKFYTGFRLSNETEIITGVPNLYPEQNILINQSGMWAGFSMPLLRDLGRNNSGNVLFLSTLMMNKAQNVSLTDEICQFIKNTLIYYYNSYKSVKVFKILKDADKDAHDYFSDIESRIADEQLPKVEVYRAKAYQVNIALQLSVAKNEITNSFYDLITTLGMKEIMIPKTLPVFLDSLPDPASFPWNQYSSYIFKNVDSLVVSTLYYKSQELITASSQIAMNGARYNKLNELNLDFRYEYFGSTSDMPISDFRNTFSSGSPGTALNLTLSYKIPFKNEERKGDYLAKLSSYEFNKTQLEKIKFESKLQVIKLLSDLGNLITYFKNEAELADLEKKTFQSEVQKFNLGASTQIDMINTYMDYNTALMNMETGRLAIMTRLITLKYLIGDFPTTTDQLINYQPWKFTVK